MDLEKTILDNIDICINNTKTFFNSKIINNPKDAILKLFLLNNINSMFYFNPLKKNYKNITFLGYGFNIILLNYFNNMNTWILFPETGILLIVPLCMLSKIDPNNIWNNINFEDNNLIKFKYMSKSLNQFLDSPNIIISKTNINSIFINNSNVTLNQAVLSYSYIY